LQNIEVIKDYETWTSGRIVAVADYAIALHNSLGDEMLQVGKPVIIYDPPLVNYPSGFLNLYDDLVVKDEDGVNDRIIEIRNGSTDRYKNAASKMYDIDSGSVRARLSLQLNNIVNSLN